MSNAKDLNPAEMIVQLAGRDFVVRRVPMAKTRQLAPMLSELAKDVDLEKLGDKLEKNPKAATKEIGSVLERVVEFPHKILSLFIKGLPEDIFKDEENGVTFPDFMDALHAALVVNRLDMLKNLFSRQR